MDFYTSLPWHTLVPKAVAYVTVGTLLAWFVYLIGPALRASQSSKYEGFEWVKGERGLSNFFSVAYEVIFKAEGLFKTAYEKVSRLILCFILTFADMVVPQYG